MLKEREIRFHVIEIDQIDIGGAIRQEYIQRVGGQRTSLPAIWINGEFIGGCNDGSPGLVPLIEIGRLDAMLQK